MTPDRRTFLGASVGVTASLASRSNGLITPTRAGSSDSPPLRGEISWNADVRAAAAGDFGRLIHKQPRTLVRPTSSADIASLMRWAKSQGVRVAARGQGHSVYGRALAEDGVVIDMGAIGTIRDAQEDRIVV